MVISKDLSRRIVRDALIYKFKNDKYLVVHITFSRHNVVIVVTNLVGDIFMRDTCGSLGFTKSNRNTYLAFFSVGERISWQLHRVGITRIHIWLRGSHTFRKAPIFGLLSRKFVTIELLRDVTPIVHNGCRLCARRRLRRRRRALLG